MFLQPNLSLQNAPLLRFKAGKLNREGNMLIADERKGQVSIEKQADGMLHFIWSLRNSPVPENNLIVFPEEVEFLPVPQCKTGKVFVLKFKTSSTRFYLWLQEEDSEEFGESFIKKVNKCLMIKGTSSKSSKSTKASSSSKAANPSALEQVLENVKRSRPGNNNSITFSKLITYENISLLLDNEKIRESLFSFMPPTALKTREELENTIRSPQFLQTLSFMDDALRGGDLAPLLLELGVDPSIGPVGGLEALIKALSEKERKMDL